MSNCRHKPPCGSSATRFACAQRTATESAVNRGLFDREAGRKLLAKYGVPMTPASRVYKGEPEDRQERLL